MACGRCGHKTGKDSNYCPRCRWTLFSQASEHSAVSDAARIRLETPRGMGSFLEKRRHESHHAHLSRTIHHAVEARLKQLEKQLEANPQNGELQRALGEFSMIERHWERANAHLAHAHQLNPHSLETTLNYAIVLANRGQWPAAIDVLQTARKEHGEQPLLLINLALIALQARRADCVLEAVDALEHMWWDDSNVAVQFHDDAMTARGLALLLQNKPREARAALEAAARHTVIKAPPAEALPVEADQSTWVRHNDVPSPDHEAAASSAGVAEDSSSGQTDGHANHHAHHHEETHDHAHNHDHTHDHAPHSQEERVEFDEQSVSADLLNNLAIAEEALGQTDKAVARLMAALRLDPSNSRVQNNLGVLAYQQGRLDIAQKYLDMAHQIDEGAACPDPALINNYGVMLSARGDVDAGLEQFQHAGAHERAEFEVFYNLGRAYIEFGKPDKGVEFLRRAFALDPNHADVHTVLGAAYLLRGQPNLLAEALKHLKRALQLQAQHRVALCDLALTLIETENEEAAAKILSQTLKQFPRSVEALFLVGLLTINEGGKENWAAAGSQFLQTLEVRPDLTACLYNAALCQHLMGLQEASAKQLQAVTQRDPSFAPAYYLLGVGHAVAKRFDEALDSWQKALVFEPNNPDLQANMGCIHYHRQQWDRAIKCYMAAHRLVPTEAEFLSQLGLCFARAGMHTQAIAAFNQSLAIKAHSPITHSNLGLAYYLEKRVENAMAHWRIVSQLDRAYAEKRDEEEHRTFDDSLMALRPLNWRQRVVRMAPALPPPHTRLLPGFNATALRPAFADAQLTKLAEQRRDLEQTDRRLAWLNAHVK